MWLLSNPLLHSLALGLLCPHGLFAGAFAAPSLLHDDGVARSSAIAIKLNPGTFSTSPSTRALSGSEVVHHLVRKAHPATKLAKRDLEFAVSPLITTLSPEKIAEMVERATALDPTYVPANFDAWFRVRFTDASANTSEADVKQLLKNLAGYQEVASCQRLAGAPLPALHPNRDPLFKNQTYLRGSGEGINAQYAWGFPGGDGSGTNFVDVERGWQLTHQDLVAKNITLLAGLNFKDHYFGNYPHGTAVLGEILMVDNTIGGIGIAPNTNASVVGVERSINGSFPEDYQAEAIMDAASFLKFGDVMLLEMQVVDANTNLYPVEILDAEFDAIRLATALGITVVEPAANGGMDLDAPILRDGDTAPHSFLNRSSPDFRDSGAILVGAGSSTYPRARMWFSNYGGRVDVHAWGENITTTSVDEDYNDTYTDQFDGTSGAAPIVAGAALSIQGMVHANRGAKLSPADLRKLIAVGGTQTVDPASDRIGVMPDLKALIDGGHLR